MFDASGSMLCFISDVRKLGRMATGTAQHTAGTMRRMTAATVTPARSPRVVWHRPSIWMPQKQDLKLSGAERSFLLTLLLYLHLHL